MPPKGNVPAGGGYVAGYTKADGTVVKGYWREGPSGGGARPTAAQAQAQAAIKRGGAVRSRKSK